MQDSAESHTAKDQMDSNVDSNTDHTETMEHGATSTVSCNEDQLDIAGATECTETMEPEATCTDRYDEEQLDVDDITDCTETVGVRMTSRTNIPSALSNSRWESWHAKWKWLFCEQGKVGCMSCKEVKRLVNIGKGIKISNEWSSCSVTVPSSSKAKNPVKKLRDKI